MIEKLKQMIDESENIVFFGGAGVSTESGIPDFRSVDGLYNLKYKYPPEKMISHSFFVKNTEEFYDFYRDKMIYLKAQPNECHKYLVYLENKGKLKAIVTQNIDNLHYLAGSKNVLELHGNIMRNYCMKCHKSYEIDKILNEKIPKCSCGGTVKPDVVLYEEGLCNETIEKTIKAISNADMLIIAGTSLAVYPAASFVNYYKGNKLVVINKTELLVNADLVINKPVSQVFLEISNL